LVVGQIRIHNPITKKEIEGKLNIFKSLVPTIINPIVGIFAFEPKKY
jgi:hypothetical protein